jgi:hypothetical protein
VSDKLNTLNALEALKTLLRATDPLAHEKGLSEAEVRMLRQKVVLAAMAPRSGWWPGTVAVAGSVIVALVVGAIAGIRLAPGISESPRPTVSAQQSRQLQFETPGGTRVVWVLNPELDLPKDRQQ